MAKNKEIFKKYQREANLGKTKHARLLDKHVITCLVKYVKKDFDKITKDDLVAFFNDLESGKIKSKRGKPYSKLSIETYKFQIRKFFKWFTNEKDPEIVSWLHPNINKVYKTKTNAEMLTHEEIDILISTARNPRDKAIIAVLYDSACRVSEFSHVLIGEIIYRENQVSIVVNGKTGQREIPLNFSVPYLEAYLITHPYKDNKGAPLWINQFGRRLTNSGVSYTIRGLLKNSKLQKKVHPHLLRHSRLTNLAEKGMTETQMKIFAGWSETSTTPSKYLHLTNDNVRRKVYELDGRVDPIEDEVERRVESRMAELKETILNEMMAYFNKPGEVKLSYKD